MLIKASTPLNMIPLVKIPKGQSNPKDYLRKQLSNIPYGGRVAVDLNSTKDLIPASEVSRVITAQTQMRKLVIEFAYKGDSQG